MQLVRYSKLHRHRLERLTDLRGERGIQIIRSIQAQIEKTGIGASGGPQGSPFLILLVRSLDEAAFNLGFGPACGDFASRCQDWLGDPAGTGGTCSPGS
jgi:hypothetical protein